MRLSINMMLFALAVAVMAVACSSAATPDARVRVAASVYPMAYFAERIGGEDVIVETLVPRGVEAHAFEPRAAELRSLSAADVVVVNGLGLEPWLGRALDALADDAPSALVEAGGADGIGAADSDPHVWLDPVLAQDQVRRIRDALVAADPANAASYGSRAGVLLEDLQALDAAFVDGLARCRLDTVVTTHAAYGYLADRYGFAQVPIAGLDAEDEVSPQHLADVVDEVKALGLEYLLVEPALSDRLARTVERETGAESLVIHQIGSVTEAELAEVGDYMALMRGNLASLRQALACDEGAGA